MPKKAVVSEVRRSLINVRTTADIRAQLEAAAAASGRSLIHEIEHRLESTFAEDRMRVIAREEMNRRFGQEPSAERKVFLREQQAAAMASLMRYTDDHPNGGQ